MTAASFSPFLALVWPANGDFDSPKQGYHVTPSDPGGGTFGGVIEATWQACVARGIVAGELKDATTDQLQAVLRAECWGPVCDALPSGLDVLTANGRMMTGMYSRLLQQCLGFTGNDIDGNLGPDTLGVASGLDAKTLIHALTGTHYAYLRQLPTWASFGLGWTRRIVAARDCALSLL